MAQPAIVLNTSKPASVDVNNSILATNQAYLCTSPVSTDTVMVIDNTALTKRLLQVGSVYLNSIISMSPNKEDHLYKGTYGALIPNGALAFGTYYAPTVSSNPYWLSATQEKIKAGVTFSSMSFGYLQELRTGSGTTVTYKIEGGLLHADGTFEAFCSTGNITTGATIQKGITVLPTTTPLVSVEGDRLAVKLTYISYTGTHSASNYNFISVGTPLTGSYPAPSIVYTS